MIYFNYLNSSTDVFLTGIMVSVLVYYLFSITIPYFKNINNNTLKFQLQIPLFITLLLSTIWFSISQSSYYALIGPWYTSIILTILLLIWIKSSISLGYYLINKFVKKEKESHDIVPIVENIYIVFILLFFIFSILKIWSVNITPFLASAGIAGLIVGFAARDTIENFFGGIALYADQTYYIGDFIELDDSTRGWVREISIRSTVLHTLDGDSVTIPNSKLHKSIIRNKSHPKNAFRTTIQIGVSYNSNPKHVKEIITNEINDVVNEENSVVLDNPNPQIHLREFSNSAITFEIFVWINLPNQKPKVQNIINNRLYDVLQENNVKIPYPQRTIHFGNDSNRILE